MNKIAVATDDGMTISPHFGRATQYAVYTVEDGRIIDREVRDKASHREFQRKGTHEHKGHHDARGRGFGEHAGKKHRAMFEAIPDCEVVIARGMGQGAYQGLQQHGIRPILTEIVDIDMAVAAVIDGSIVDHPERLH